jgi:imidazolonepropionase-like amidohydrolase
VGGNLRLGSHIYLTTPSTRSDMRRYLLATALATATIAQAQTTAPQAATVIRAARLIDGSGTAPVANGVVVVRGDRIIAAGPATSVAVPVGARIIDLGDATLMPGFIDAHTHLMGRTLNNPNKAGEDTRDFPGVSAIFGAENARRTLMAGFTTVRNLGSARFEDVGLRQAVNEGIVPGPRIQTAAHSLGITGGHCDENGYRPGMFDGSIESGIADGPDQVRAAVRYQVKYGADVIKTCATGGVLSEGDAVGVPQYTYEELKAMVDEATKLERKVAAHALGTEGIKIAVRAGVASIEHGSFLDAEGARMMKERGTYLVPTLMAGETVELAAKKGTLTGLRGEKALAAAAAMRNAIKIAKTNGVPVAFGTDAGVGEHGDNAREFELLVEWGGFTPLEAITTATSSAAKLLGWEDRIGTLGAGKFADIIAVPGDASRDIKLLRKPSFVMKNGVIYRGAPPGAE